MGCDEKIVATCDMVKEHGVCLWTGEFSMELYHNHMKDEQACELLWTMCPNPEEACNTPLFQISPQTQECTDVEYKKLWIVKPWSESEGITYRQWRLKFRDGVSCSDKIVAVCDQAKEMDLCLGFGAFSMESYHKHMMNKEVCEYLGQICHKPEDHMCETMPMFWHSPQVRVCSDR